MIRLFIFIVSWPFVIGNQDACLKECRCEKHRAYCLYSSLEYIPPLPPSITFLEFKGNNLRTINRTTFQSIKRNNITHLYLSYNQVISLSEDSLQDLTSLKRFGLSYEINITHDLASVLYSISRSIDHIGFTHMRMEKLPNLDGLINTMIRKLDFSYNYMKFLDGAHFVKLRSLKNLDFSYNAVSYNCSFEGLQMITNLNLAGNWFRKFPNFTKMQQLRSLHIQNTKISVFLERDFYGLTNLEYLNLNGHAVRVLYNNTFSTLKSLKTLELRRLSGQLDYINMYAFNSSSLKNLSLSNNHFHFRTTNVAFSEIFAHAPNLQVLDLSHNYIKLNESEFLSMISPLKELKELIMVNVQFYFVSNNMSHFLSSLTSLNLSQNSISGWDGNALLKNFTTLRVLDLSKNRITKINETSFPFATRSSLESLNLEGNPFSCSCKDIKWFYKWMCTTNGSSLLQLDKTSKGYKCSSPYGLHDKQIHQLKYRDVCPIDPTLINVIISCASMIGCVLLCLFIFHRCRWNIRFGLFQLNQKRKRCQREGSYSPLPRENDFLYDCFPIYADEDVQFVKNKLIKVLEERCSRTLCVRDRDFGIGSVFVDNITESIEESRNVLLLLSNNFARSRWCRFQLQIALHRMAEEGKNSLVVVVLQEISYKYLTNTLRTVLVTTPYITWSDEITGERLFWERLLQKIPSSSAHRTEIVVEEADNENNVLINSG